jgi:hypothetical protein
MSNIIAFLEQAGRDASMRHASRKALLQAMHKEEFTPAMQNALLRGDSSLLDAPSTMHCKNGVVIQPKMHCKNGVVIQPKMHCMVFVVTPPKKKTPARMRRVKVTLK